MAALAILAAALVVILRPRAAEGRCAGSSDGPGPAPDHLPAVVRALRVIGAAPAEALKGVSIDADGQAVFDLGAILPPGRRPAYDKARRAIDPGRLDVGPLMADLLGPIRDGAERGEPGMAMLLAHLHRRGFGVPEDLDEAYRLTLLAAEAGDLVAASHLGDMLLDGLGTLPDFGEAVVWLRRALPLNATRTRMALWYARVFRPDLVTQAEAVESLIIAFSRGDELARVVMDEGVAEDSATVEDWRLAALDGDPGNSLIVGMLLLFGHPKDRDEAGGLAALRQAARGRDQTAARLLERLYREGARGCPRDEAEADKWALARKRPDDERLSGSFRPDAPASWGSAADRTRAGRAGQGEKPRKSRKRGQTPPRG
jgi:TPR repeat protein